MTRGYGRARKGQRIRDRVPGGHWKILTILGTMDHTGMLASMTVESATDGDVFLAFLDQVLCPKLRARPRGRDGQSQRAQGRRHTRKDRGLRGIPALPAALLARCQSDRKGLGQAQSPSPRTSPHEPCRNSNTPLHKLSRPSPHRTLKPGSDFALETTPEGKMVLSSQSPGAGHPLPSHRQRRTLRGLRNVHQKTLFCRYKSHKLSATKFPVAHKRIYQALLHRGIPAAQLRHARAHHLRPRPPARRLRNSQMPRPLHRRSLAPTQDGRRRARLLPASHRRDLARDSTAIARHEY